MTDDLMARLDALEARVTLEAGLRASVDRDLATLGQRMSAAKHLLQALALTQSEHGEQIARLIETTDRHTAVLDGHTAVLDQQTAALRQIIALLGGSPDPA